MRNDQKNLRIREAELTDPIMEALITLSANWEAEQSCWGYRKNTPADIEGNRIWLAEDEHGIIGYLFGHMETADTATSFRPKGTVCFEIEELYVSPARRSRGIGKMLMETAEDTLRREGQAEMLMLSTATKNWKAILHFYLEELDFSFWSARLFKPLRGA